MGCRRSAGLMSSIRTFLFGTLACCCLSGCGGDDGLTDYALSGRVTYDGKPVPAGGLSMRPDTAKGNTGPGTAATIKDGRFATETGKGHIGGAYVITVRGLDGVPVKGEFGEMDHSGSPLFPPYKMTVELPSQDSQLDIEVPVNADTARPHKAAN